MSRTSDALISRRNRPAIHTGSRAGPKTLALARAQVSRQLSGRLPYYLTPEEAHAMIEAAGNERDRLLLRLLWETGARVRFYAQEHGLERRDHLFPSRKDGHITKQRGGPGHQGRGSAGQA